jgi:hypothetical protein
VERSAPQGEKGPEGAERVDQAEQDESGRGLPEDDQAGGNPSGPITTFGAKMRPRPTTTM